jgi:hypothetical protein
MLHLIILLVLIPVVGTALFWGLWLVLATFNLYLKLLAIAADLLFWRPLLWLLRQLVPHKHGARQDRLAESGRRLNPG